MIASELEAKKMKTLHMIKQVWAVWKKWNEEEVARPQIGFAGYDGIDWDVEGSDTEESPSNVMTVEVMDLMGKVSQLAKKDGYLASLSAMESYLDPSTSAYNRSLLQSYNEWEGLEPGFRFHGRNTLAYVLEVYGESESCQLRHLPEEIGPGKIFH
ncbi:hypothetical protein GUITHDRAFT_103256 [Guillardia theta CCMP2712]|uniref:Uncharacterized protein n=1 Tax=Guillardia theta (strain CCMP2712) TaxID=905079 RepID=L1JST2_GUITC|nr:hypothetical protein GUITHDRAFT_103256 [Guillardia theta CCMP2712]EKX51339.1 hypothetical protein GUITHDRAFT_103256 [Guillardia theta CCMP2712]|eukprot:XP_005838319.1 hypothetical protein GUITHDRAFT_103256 [Guillardia theta CCMP2712]